MKLDNVLATRHGKTIYREGDKCFKVFDEGYSKVDILNEALNLARIEETGLHVPELHGVTMVQDRWALIYQYVEGIDLAHLMRENPQKMDEYLQTFVKLQCQVHNLSCPMLTRYKDKMARKFGIAELDAVTLYDLFHRLNAIPNKNRVCHGDLIPSNVIISNGGVPYILDWSHATQGHASVDVARTYLVFRMRGNAEIAEKYLDMICQQDNVDKQSVFDCMPIVAAEQYINDDEQTDFLQKIIDGLFE